MRARLIKKNKAWTDLEVGNIYDGCLFNGWFKLKGCERYEYQYSGHFEEVKDEKPVSQGSTFHKYACGTKKAEDIQIDAIRSVAQMECPVSGFIITSAESRNQLNLWADFLEKCKAESAKELG